MMPLVRLSPLDANIFSCASGLVAKKFKGDIASIVCWVAKRIFLRVLASTSAASTKAFINFEFNR